jgi:hypothetical protein
MSFELEIDAASVFAKLDGVGEEVRKRFAASAKAIEEKMLADAKANAVRHFHSVGEKPGVYLASFSGGVKETDGGVIGWVRNGARLAHLMEYGFTISDFIIGGGVDALMRFDGDVGAVYRREIHRHATAVQAYPAIGPAFEAHKDEIETAARDAVKDL